ncbi:MAG: glycosyltransferase family 2 protein [Patescibacteria group bacterium]|nr:glycosyltransferase family 2 protein [Patescibacteria group bacterium]MDD5294318.1 glycosyltransferase family 2 protein [Patescibacteria group bacterium]MDD5554141.1 glycosyltransferase family 2 protein [Patescibacteria group bacterium]
MDLSIIIVSWNVREKLRQNLEALQKSQGDLEYEIFVVDNNSNDGSAEMVSKEFPEVKLIANDSNLGFAKANNQALKQARGGLILLLNPDMRVFSETLSNMAGWMRENKRAAVAGCRLVNEKGETIRQVRRFPTLWDQLVIVLKLPHLFPNILSRYLRVDFDYEKGAPVDSIRGSFFMVRRETIEKVGLLDEKYFIWFEEVDYCQRAKRDGLEVWYTPAAKCLDYVGQSFNQLPRGRAQKYFCNSQLAYFRKWQPAWQYRILKLAWIPGMFMAWIGEKMRIKSKAKT